MRTNDDLRALYGPECYRGPYARITLHGGAVLYVHPLCAEAFLALNDVFRKYDYRCTPPDCGAYNCRRITGGTGLSLHSFAIGADINWNDNPYGKTLVTDMPRAMSDAGKAIRTNGGVPVFRWGGDFRTNKDAMHWEVNASPDELRRGIDPRSVAGRNAPPPAPAPSGRTTVSAPPGVPSLSRGDSGESVKKLQYALNYGTGTALRGDGDFGAQTEQAVKNLQNWFRLRVDGEYGPQSQWVLQVACNAKYDRGR